MNIAWLALGIIIVPLGLILCGLGVLLIMYGCGWVWPK